MLFYQATWISSVTGAGHGRWWPGIVVLAAFAAWQLSVSPWPRADTLLMLSISVLGFGIDTIFLQHGLMLFATPVPWPGLAPIWMVALWTSFALALNHSLAFLHHRAWLGCLLGCCGAPAAYWAASRGWHALAFGDRPLLCLVLVGLIWALLMPWCAELALRWRRFDEHARWLAAGGSAP
jgi:Protein of unknown function (DUF2878)